MGLLPREALSAVFIAERQFPRYGTQVGLVRDYSGLVSMTACRS